MSLCPSRPLSCVPSCPSLPWHFSLLCFPLNISTNTQLSHLPPICPMTPPPLPSPRSAGAAGATAGAGPSAPPPGVSGPQPGAHACRRPQPGVARLQQRQPARGGACGADACGPGGRACRAGQTGADRAHRPTPAPGESGVAQRQVGGWLRGSWSDTARSDVHWYCILR